MTSARASTSEDISAKAPAMGTGTLEPAGFISLIMPPPGAFGGAQLAAELLGALELLSDNPLLADLIRAFGPCVL